MPDSVEAGYLLSRYGMALDYEYGDHEGAQAAFDKAVAIARREGEWELELRTLVSASHVDAIQLRYKESLEKDMRSIELAAQVDQAADEAHAHFEVAQVLFAMGDLEGAGILDPLLDPVSGATVATAAWPRSSKKYPVSTLWES